MQGNRENIIYNNEGYLDLTAYNAIKNLYKGDYHMATWNDGDIIKLKLPDGREVYRVVIKAQERYATTLTLFNEECYENEYRIKVPEGPGHLHADLGKIAFTKNWDLNDAEFVMAMDDKSFTKLLRKIGETLGIPTIATGNDDDSKKWAEQYKDLQDVADSLTSDNRALVLENDSLKEKVETLEKSNAEVYSEYKKVKGELDSKMEELSFAVERDAASRAGAIRAAAERDVYKELYMDVANKFMGAGGTGA